MRVGEMLGLMGMGAAGVATSVPKAGALAAHQGVKLGGRIRDPKSVGSSVIFRRSTPPF